MIVYGRNPVREALQGRRAPYVTDVWATTNAAREPWLRGRDVRVCAPDEIERRCGSHSHQGVCADAGPYPYADPHALLAAPDPLIVVLDQVQDPQNLGSICRTSECCGCTGVVIPDRRSSEVTPAACKASAGAVEHLSVARVRNIADFLLQAREAGCWCYGASAPPTAAIPYTDPDYRGGVVLVLGSEGRGLRPRVASACDQLISLPMRGQVQSLGVSAAAAALLYGILQARTPMLDKSP